MTAPIADPVGPLANLRAHHLVPLWEVATSLVSTEPKPSCAAYHWDYVNTIRPAMIAAGESISPEEAERRVLLLANPLLQRPATTATVAAGIQMINGGEVAHSHRHTQAALRVVIEGEGAYTAVNGERFPMKRGDLILTPSWTWHDHEKASDGPMIWLDGLDVPLMGHLSVSFYEEMHNQQVARSRPDGFSQSSFGRGLTPLDDRFRSHVPASLSAPQLRYPYEAAREVLSLMCGASDPDPRDGYTLRYTNSVTGGHILPTIGAFLKLLPKGFASRAKRRTDAQIFLALEGSGESRIGDQTFSWRENDIFVVPNWTWYSHAVGEDAVLFSFSDCALQETIGIWREEAADTSSE